MVCREEAEQLKEVHITLSEKQVMSGESVLSFHRVKVEGKQQGCAG